VTLTAISVYKRPSSEYFNFKSARETVVNVIRNTILSLLLLPALISCAQTSNLSYLGQDAQNLSYYDKAPPKLSNSDKSSQDLSISEKDIVFLMLAQTQEFKIHQMRGATGNKVFLHKDGHKEAVFDKDGQLVKDGFNDASYNYAHPIRDPFGHYTKDIEPWMTYGASRKDPTSKKERIDAYVLDLEDGIIRARKLWPELSAEFRKVPQTHANFPKSWAKVFKDSKNRKVLQLIRGDIELTDDNRISSLKLLHAALNEIY